MIPGQMVLGAALAAGIALAAYLVGSLSASGALAALAIGAITFGFGGLTPAVLLVAFFVSSSLLSSLGRRRKEQLAEKFAKGSTRDAAQVAANGAVAAGMALMLSLQGSQFWLAGLLGALAAVTADTWATELGVLARSQPRRLTDWSHAPPGTSGAVTFEGSLAAAAAALLLGGLAALMTAMPVLALAGFLGGVAGAFFDSLLGASLQARYHCPECGRQTEHAPVHTCGAETEFSGGLRWLNNDVVNGLASVVGAAVALAVNWLGA